MVAFSEIGCGGCCVVPVSCIGIVNLLHPTHLLCLSDMYIIHDQPTGYRLG